MEEIILVLGNNYEEMLFNIEKSSAYKSNKLKIVYNKKYEDGLSTSIVSGIKNIKYKKNSIMICLGDMPLINLKTYNKIIDCALKINSRSIIIPHYKKKKGNPILFSAHFKNDLCNLKGDKGASLILKKFEKDIIKLNCMDSGILKDIDNKVDFEHYINEL